MPFVQHNDLSFHTQVLGTGAPVCMLHGLLVGSMTTWYFTAAPRLARTHRVLLYDLRGHGRSSRPRSGYDLETMASDLEVLLESFAPPDGPPVTLVGHSYGALTALRFALRHPGRIARLALVEAPIPPSQAGDLGAFISRGPEEMARALPSILSETVQRGGRAGARFIEQVRFLATETTLLDDLAQERGFDPAAQSPAAAAFRAPVLCIYGDRSSCLPAGEQIARAIPGAQLVILPGGHYLPVEASQAVADELERFCRG